MDPASLGTAFTVWAAVVLMVGGVIAFQLKSMRADLHAMTQMLNDHMVETQGRLTAVETELESMRRFIPANYFGQRP